MGIQAHVDFFQVPAAKQEPADHCPWCQPHATDEEFSEARMTLKDCKKLFNDGFLLVKVTRVFEGSCNDRPIRQGRPAEWPS